MIAIDNLIYAQHVTSMEKTIEAEKSDEDWATVLAAYGARYLVGVTERNARRMEIDEARASFRIVRNRIAND